MRVWPVWLLVFTVLAGCSKDVETIDDVQAPGIGNLRGVVVDDAIVPIEGATVVLMEFDLNTSTGAEGLFGFDNLEEGQYRVQASKEGHDPVETTVVVRAGESQPEPVRIELARIPGTVPLAVPAIHTGWIGCEALVLYVLQNCDGGQDTFGDPDNHILLSQPDRVPQALHVEVAWVAAQDFAESLTLTYGTCDGIEYCDPQPPSDTFLCSAWGASPLWCRVNHAAAERSGEGVGHNTLGEAGHGERPLTGVAIHVGADCTECMPSPYESWGLGLAVQQEIEVFTWAFFNFEPPEGWSFVDDGAP